MTEFRISVIIPTFNRVRFLCEALDSVLAQTVPVYEIIVIDDGSTDDTEKTVRNYRGNIRYLRQNNQGPSAARNYGMREATGDWIAFLDSDDLWVPDKIQAQTDLIRQHPHLDFVFGDLSLFDETKHDNEPEILNKTVQEYMITHAADLKDFFRQLLICNPIPTSAVLFRRECLLQTGYFDETMRYCEDYDLWLRFAAKYRLGFVNKILVRRRMHDSNAMNAHEAIYNGSLKVFKRLEANGGLSPEMQQTVSRRIFSTQYDLASHLAKRKQFEAARVHFRELQSRKIDGLGMLQWKIRVKIWLLKLFPRLIP
jgi:glycosyltransferase involved in cell wall biosynthesis